MNPQDKAMLQKMADTVRVLSAEAVEKAGCGHPGLPLGCAELGAYLYARQMRHNPGNPGWIGRDRFILSAGHGSMFQYSLLHLSGYDVTLDDLKNFRQLDSRTPGHPEIGTTAGVETTTGPLGQGFGAGVGMALAARLMQARFGAELFDQKVWVLSGDGCMMEGISHESANIAGHLGLGNLVLIYDSNDICLDGETSECFSEDTAGRFEAYGWRVIQIDGHDFDQIEEAFQTAATERERPTLILARTIIGKGCPTKAGTNAAHGAKLGQDEIDGMKQALGWPEEAFHVPPEVVELRRNLQATCQAYEDEWNKHLEALKAADPQKAELLDGFLNKTLPEDFADQIWEVQVEPGNAGRKHSQAVIAKVAELVPWFFSGSADLSVSDSSNIKWAGNISREDFTQRNFKFGVREFGMCAANYGMALTGFVQPLCGTFLQFSDYMRNAIRIAAMTRARVFFQFTHDTVWIGEDGPTHQPIEHVAALRAIPGLSVFRPADENEIKATWIEMFNSDGPVALVTTRQKMASLGELTRETARAGVARGGYVLYGEPGPAAVDVMICSAGSEVPVAVEAARLLETDGKKVRVVSMPCWERFDAQGDDYKAEVLGGEAGLRVSVEALTGFGWHKYIGSDGLTISLDAFGISAPWKVLLEHYGFTPQKVAEKISAHLPVLEA